MAKKGSFNGSAAPEQKRNVAELGAEWQRLGHELLAASVLELLLDKDDMNFNSAEVEAHIAAENQKRIDMIYRLNGLQNSIDFDAIEADTRALLDHIVSKKNQTTPFVSSDAAKNAADQLERAVEILSAESERRKQSDRELMELVQDAQDAWMKRGLPTGESVPVRPPLRFKPPGQS